jgi:hypothetical protein
MHILFVWDKSSPVSFVLSSCSLFVTRIIIHGLRNVNEQKDPLPLPEGRCDL